jgi:hypothetical protein
MLVRSAAGISNEVYTRDVPGLKNNGIIGRSRSLFDTWQGDGTCNKQGTGYD